MSARIDGVDLSHWQGGSIDLAAAKRAGVRFVYHKATEGTGYHDPNYAKRRAEAKRAGIPFGAYHFAKPTKSSGVAQARYFLSVAKPVKGDMRPMLDFEDPVLGSWSRAKRTAWVKSFVGEVKRQTGVEPFIYTPFDLDAHFDCPLWVARYSNAMSAPRIPKPWKHQTIWQFSNGVYGKPNSVPGIGHCDLNTFNGDPAHLTDVFTLGHKDPAPAPKPAPKPAPAPTPADHLTIVTANFWRGNPQREADVKTLVGTGAHIIGINEAREIKSLLEANAPGYHVVIPDQRAPQTQNPILLREDLTLLGQGAQKMCDKVGPSPERNASWVTYDYAGEKRCHIQTHFNSHVQVGEKPRALPRVKQYVTHMRRLSALVKAKQAQGFKVTVAGDTNWNWGSSRWAFSPFAVFQKGLGFWNATSPLGGTKGNRNIDAILYHHSDLRVVARSFVAGEHSDHRWPEVKFRVK